MKRVCSVSLIFLLAIPLTAQQQWYFPGESHGGVPGESRSGFELITPFISGENHPGSLQWPLDRQLGDGVFLSNYVDNDQGSTSMTDYMGGHDHLYDDHRGTDIAAVNFRLMDKGVYVLAPAAGTVLRTTYNFGDRNTTTPYPDGGNGIVLRHADGSESYYWHIRTNSAMVEPGEEVEAGQPLAFVGSSGWTPIPHLHFELSGARDPWQGTYNTAPSLWDDQPEYVGDAPIWVMDQGIFTLQAVGGSTAGITDSVLKERISQPAMVGDQESEILAWIHVQGNVGDQVFVEIVRPDESVAHSETQGISRKTRYGWHVFEIPLPGERPQGDWKLRTSSNGRILGETTFRLGSETRYPPRFRPVAGRSLRIEGHPFSETLKAVPPGGQATYHLVNAPSSVTLNESTVTISGESNQPYRSAFFDVVATDGFAQTDTMRYHLVDPSKPFNPIVTSIKGPQWDDIPRSFNLLPGHPNPASDHHVVQFDMLEHATLRVEVYDALGRQIKNVDLGWHSPGLTSYLLDTAAFSPGSYFYRVMTPSHVFGQQFVLVR